MIREAILRGADAYDARRAFDENERAEVMNASEALTCIRKQWYSKNGAEADKPQDWGYARRGTHGERYIVERLRLANVPMLFTGDDQVRIVDDELQIACTPDGLVMIDDCWYAAEFKTIDPRTNKTNLPKEEHVRQVQIAAAMFDRHRDEFPELGEAAFAGCLLIYMDASNYNDILEFRLPLKPRILDQLKGRAARLMKVKDPARLPREGKEAGGRECQQRCSFNKVCGIAGAGTSTAQGRAGGADVAKQVEEYLLGKSIEQDGKARKDAAAELIKAQLKKSGAAAVEVDGVTVSLSQRAGSVAYAKVVKEHCQGIDLEPYRGATVEVLTVK